MTMFDFTAKDVQSEVRAVAAEYPTHVYVSARKGECSYFHMGEGTNYSCGCIIGHALHRLGVTPEDIPNSNFLGVVGLLRRFMPAQDRDEIIMDWLASVQLLQDEGKSWSKAVNKADGIK
jgi:hypothetical protein